MKRRLVVCAVLGVSACADPLKPAQLLEEPRVLGVRVAGADGQTSLNPGQSATFEVLLAGPQPSLEARLAYQWCRAAGSTRGVPFCEAAPFAQDTTDLDQSAISFPLPSDLDAGAHLALLGVACLASEPELADSPLDWRCADQQTPLRFSFDARASDEHSTNENPDLSGLTLAIDGSDVPLDSPDAPGGCDAGSPVLAAGASHRVELRLGARARELGDATSASESLQLSHFTTSGAFERQYSFVEGDQPCEATLSWRAPAGETDVKQYLVVRDSRGGVSWVSWSLCTR